jgi:hypothetical protein
MRGIREPGPQIISIKEDKDFERERSAAREKVSVRGAELSVRAE